MFLGQSPQSKKDFIRTNTTARSHPEGFIRHLSAMRTMTMQYYHKFLCKVFISVKYKKKKKHAPLLF